MEPVGPMQVGKVFPSSSKINQSEHSGSYMAARVQGKGWVRVKVQEVTEVGFYGSFILVLYLE